MKNSSLLLIKSTEREFALHQNKNKKKLDYIDLVENVFRYAVGPGGVRGPATTEVYCLWFIRTGQELFLTGMLFLSYLIKFREKN